TRTALPRREEILQRNVDDRPSNDRLHNAAWHLHGIQCSEGKRERVRDREARDDLRRGPESVADQKEREQEEEVIVPARMCSIPRRRKPPEEVCGAALAGPAAVLE
ncbi:MAG: hypothetical protein M3463_23870, partial [Verrucomicrobiota bacterium]|nr:hypothetical protein [Verrucomicrobiota bacterium]